MATKFEIPKPMRQRIEEEALPAMQWPVDSKMWFDKEANDSERKRLAWAAPVDPRFPQQNKAKWCWTYYVDFQRCKTLKGEDYAPCQYFKNVYADVCPQYWVERWDEWVEEGRFPARFDK